MQNFLAHTTRGAKHSNPVVPGRRKMEGIGEIQIKGNDAGASVSKTKDGGCPWLVEIIDAVETLSELPNPEPWLPLLRRLECFSENQIMIDLSNDAPPDYGRGANWSSSLPTVSVTSGENG